MNKIKNNIEEMNQKKPAYSFFLHVSDLDYNSKRHLNAFDLENNYKSIITFDTKKEIINGIDFSNLKEKPLFNNFQIKDNRIIQKNILNINHAINQSNDVYSNNNNTNSNHIFQQQNQNKKLLGRPKLKRKQKNKNKKKSRNSSFTSNYCYLSKKNKVNKNKSKSSQSSDKSVNSTKRTNNLLKTRNSPEKYPQDYSSVEASSDEEKELKSKEIQISPNCNSLFLKNILEKGKILNNDFDPKKDIEQKLEGFDLMSVDLKKLIRDKDFKKKYFKNFKANIKIVYFEKETFPLHAIFIFNDKKHIIKRDKILFPGAYNKDEFIEFCSKMKMKNTNKNVELLMDYADFPKYQDLEYDLNLDLFIDFYFLVDILNED